MLNKFMNKIFLVALCCSTATYAATNASMWGNNSIDQPIPPIQQIEAEQQQIQAQQQAIANEQTICEILTAQPTLATSDPSSAAKLREALTQAAKNAAHDYKYLLINTDATNALYAKWRDLYMKTYCTASTK